MREVQDTFDHDEDRNLEFQGAVSTALFELSPVDTIYAISQRNRTKSGESHPASGRREMHEILSRLWARLWLSWFLFEGA